MTDTDYEVDVQAVREGQWARFAVYVPREEVELADQEPIKTIIEVAKRVVDQYKISDVDLHVEVMEDTKCFEENKVAFVFWTIPNEKEETK